MDYFNYSRRETVQIQVGTTTIGGDAPVRIQTMANTDTNDIEASLAQAVRCCNAGAELLRFTTQGTREAQSLGTIHDRLRDQGITPPLVADIHFNPKVAETAAALVEKVRINPGNFVPGKESEYTQEEWDAELEAIRAKLRPLLDICRRHGTAVRIGVNHGSLSPRIMSRYGNTPEGLAASCIEFIEMCEKEDFRNIVLSVKASNTLVMIHAVRLLVREMDARGMRYPIHLGVTEAGSDDEGRIKSAVGIGTLLADGIGDTVRVSLSEAPEAELPVARTLVRYITARAGHKPISGKLCEGFSPYSFSRRESERVGRIGGGQPPVVVANDPSSASPQADYTLNVSLPFCFIMRPDEMTDRIIRILRGNPFIIALLYSRHANPVGELRAAIHRLTAAGLKNPVIVSRSYRETSIETLQIKAAADFGALLADGLVDGIMLEDSTRTFPQATLNDIMFKILQAARARITATEYISCPSCGRTKFDLPEAVRRVKAATAHLPGLKIAVMGCIVNGPGEMADADYGYIGAAAGRVSLYRGRECVAKNIPEAEATDRLLALIAADGHIPS